MISLDHWTGKVAVVTGASSGIGAAIVQELVKKGLQVVGLARRVELVEDLAAKLSDKKGILHPIRADVRNEEDIINAFSWIAENLGPIHILINNAGVMRLASLFDADTDLLREVLEVNVLGLCIATREALKVMRDKDIHGQIIHINSISGHQVANFPNMNVYPASKHAVTALTDTLRKEIASMGSKIKITSLSPGIVATELLAAENVPHTEDIPALQPEDVADAVVYILSTPEHVQFPDGSRVKVTSGNNADLSSSILGDILSRVLKMSLEMEDETSYIDATLGSLFLTLIQFKRNKILTIIVNDSNGAI